MAGWRVRKTLGRWPDPIESESDGLRGLCAKDAPHRGGSFGDLQTEAFANPSQESQRDRARGSWQHRLAMVASRATKRKDGRC